VLVYYLYLVGTNSLGSVTKPQQIEMGYQYQGRIVKKISCGWYSCIALCTDWTTLIGWGSNYASTVGDGTEIARCVPTLVTSGKGGYLSSIFNVESGYATNYFVGPGENRIIYAWGENIYGQGL
jgi:alpha-tubulin suppressor-like RCC1 family protein